MRPIDADAFKARMYHETFEKDSLDQRWDSGCWIRYRLFEKVLREAPTVEPEPKTGKWIYNPYYVCHECSECGEQALEEFTVNPCTLDRDYDEVLSNYCPHCGSRMIKVEDEEDEW